MKINGSEVYGIIYKITNKINGKVYIGQTRQKNGFKDRYGNNGIKSVYNYHISRRNYGQCINDHLIKSIEKYGFENWEIDEVFDIAYTQEELDDKEKYWIEYYKSNTREYGYNFTNGGEKPVFSEDSKIHNGTMIYSLKDGKTFKSYAEASKYYYINTEYLRNKTLKRVRNVTVKNISNFLTNDLVFKKIDKPLKINERLCKCCGKIVKLNNWDKEYCRKCYKIIIDNNIYIEPDLDYKNMNKIKTEYLQNEENIKNIINLYNDNNSINKIKSIIKKDLDKNIIISCSDIEKLLLDNGVELKEDISKSDDLSKILEYMKEIEKSNECYIEKRLKEDITLTLKDISKELNKPKKDIKRSYEKVLARIEGRTKICERCGEEFVIKNDNIKICEFCIRAIEIRERFPEIFEK